MPYGLIFGAIINKQTIKKTESFSIHVIQNEMYFLSHKQHYKHIHVLGGKGARSGGKT